MRPPDAGAVHLWRFSLDVGPEAAALLSAGLSPEERERAARFRFPEHRRRFIAARGMLRALLAAYLGCDAGELRFRYGPHGKPALEGSDPDLRFNLSHSGEAALCAVVLGAEVGVDLEQVRERSGAAAIARRHFHAEERRWLEGLPEGERRAAFFRIWTLKEAYLKARGCGLTVPPRRFCFAPPEGPGPARLLAAEPPEERERWSLCSLAAGEGFAAALAVEGRGWTIREREWAG